MRSQGCWMHETNLSLGILLQGVIWIPGAHEGKSTALYVSFSFIQGRTSSSAETKSMLSFSTEPLPGQKKVKYALSNP